MHSNLPRRRSAVDRFFRRLFPRWSARRLIRRSYNALANISGARPEFRYMNLGYAAGETGGPARELPAGDEPWRLFIQLYLEATDGADLEGREVLEVGCGRGAGADCLLRLRRPRSLIGVDLSENNIRLANENFRADGLSFQQGAAESLPFREGRFDAVVNVESSHGYPDLPKFYREAARVLRSGGFFCYADMLTKENLARVKERFDQSGFEILRARNITGNVIQAIRESTPARERAIREIAAEPWIYELLRVWSCMEGSPIHNSLRDGSREYWSYLLRKR